MRDVARVKDAHELLRPLKLLALRNGELFNASRAAVDLGLRRETVDRYLSVPAVLGAASARLAPQPGQASRQYAESVSGR